MLWVQAVYRAVEQIPATFLLNSPLPNGISMLLSVPLRSSEEVVRKKPRRFGAAVEVGQMATMYNSTA